MLTRTSLPNLLILGYTADYSNLAGWTGLCAFVRYLIVFCSRTEAACDVISGRFVRLVILGSTVLEKFHLKPSEAAFSTVFLAITSDQKWLMTSHLVAWL